MSKDFFSNNMKNLRKNKNNSNSVNIFAVANDLIFFVYTLPTFSENFRTNGSVIIFYQYFKLSTFHLYEEIFEKLYLSGSPKPKF